ncbi:DUF3822 family protein [Psychroflexus planctonicus]|uniref:DUF3822 family protein n=1 Tax=Psychroflexus planctonicus TaxID=1526575 RepID=A0ABQ1SE30_9FLAO|nr:DUF3822 family protein [Psychroflexus planctonicus]GGE31236.1 hypothetical protein GCM10010832_09570 [Psychroflexus planctonicus]
MKLAQVVTGQLTMEKQINLNTTYTHLISILITQNGYSFFVLDRNIHQVINYKSETILQASANSVLEKIDEELKKNWKKEYPNAEIKICYHHSYFAIVPSEIYSPEFTSDYLKFNTQLFPNDSISEEEIEKLSVHIPFVPYINIHNELLDVYNLVEFTHSIHSSIEWAEKLCRNQNGEHAFAFVQKDSFVLVIFKDKQLQLANYFDYVTAEDFTYYCLFAIEQFQLDREQMHFSMLGDVSIESEIHHYMYTYIKNLVLISFEELHFKVDVNSEQSNFFNTNPFLALQLCE